MNILGSVESTAKLLDTMVEKFDRQKIRGNLRSIPTTFRSKSFGIRKNSKTKSMLNMTRQKSIKQVSTLRRNLNIAMRNKNRVSTEFNRLHASRKGRIISTVR